TAATRALPPHGSRGPFRTGDTKRSGLALRGVHATGSDFGAPRLLFSKHVERNTRRPTNNLVTRRGRDWPRAKRADEAMSSDRQGGHAAPGGPGSPLWTRGVT